MTTWKDVFEIEEVENNEIGSFFTYILKLRTTGEEVGRYKDYCYAQKQAKYKYKKIVNKIERTLLT